MSDPADTVREARQYEKQLPVVLSVPNFIEHYSRMTDEYEALLARVGQLEGEEE